MNLVYKAIGAVFASAVFASSVFAEDVNTRECGEVRFVHDTSKPSVFRVATINGMSIDNKFILDAKENRLVLPVGEHSLRIAEEPKKLYGTSQWGGADQVKSFYVGNKLDAYLFSQIRNHFLSAEIEANKAYVFSVSSDKKDLKLKKIVDKICEIERQEAIEGTRYAQLDPNRLSDLELSNIYKLSEIVAHTREEGNSSGRFLPLSMLTYFGVVVDDEYDGASIKILSVHPMSSAFKLGLRSGDKIKRFAQVSAKQRHLTPVQSLEQYLSRIHYYGDIRILIERDGKKETIKGKYEPIIVPEAWLKQNDEPVTFTKISQPFNWHEQLFYSKLLRELVEGHTAGLDNIDRLSIKVDSYRTNKLGLKGELTDSGRMKLSWVDPLSVFSKLGIKEGDEIVSFGKEKNKPITLVAFTNYFKTLKLNEEIYLEIVKDNVGESIVGLYKPTVYPAIELVLDLTSIRNAEKTISLAYAEHKKERRNKIRGGSRLESSLRTRNNYRNGAASGHYNSMRSLDRIESQSSGTSNSKATRKN